MNFDNNENIIPVPLLLGADYMMSVNFWNKIQGLNGLLCWGQDETLLSLKTWLAGSKVLLIKDMIFGHVYRKKRPYTTAPVEMNSNYIYCNYLLNQVYAGHHIYLNSKTFKILSKSFNKGTVTGCIILYYDGYKSNLINDLCNTEFGKKLMQTCACDDISTVSVSNGANRHMFTAYCYDGELNL